MRHDELLIHLMVLKPEETVETRAVKLNNAIRAVVELHNPKSTGIGFTDLLCEECSGLDANDYPCATIRAIKKVLA